MSSLLYGFRGPRPEPSLLTGQKLTANGIAELGRWVRNHGSDRRLPRLYLTLLSDGCDGHDFFAGLSTVLAEQNSQPLADRLIDMSLDQGDRRRGEAARLCGLYGLGGREGQLLLLRAHAEGDQALGSWASACAERMEVEGVFLFPSSALDLLAQSSERLRRATLAVLEQGLSHSVERLWAQCGQKDAFSEAVRRSLTKGLAHGWAQERQRGQELVDILEAWGVDLRASDRDGARHLAESSVWSVGPGGSRVYEILDDYRLRLSERAAWRVKESCPSNRRLINALGLASGLPLPSPDAMHLRFSQPLSERLSLEQVQQIIFHSLVIKHKQQLGHIHLDSQALAGELSRELAFKPRRLLGLLRAY